MNFEVVLKALAGSDVDFIIVGGVAARVLGASRYTDDLDIVYSRRRENLSRLVEALRPLHPTLRGAPSDLPFLFDEETLRRGLNFTFATDAGPVDCLGQLSGVGGFEDLVKRSFDVTLFGIKCRCIDLDSLITAKRAAGRTKDFEAIAELEAIREELERS